MADETKVQDTPQEDPTPADTPQEEPKEEPKEEVKEESKEEAQAEPETPPEEPTEEPEESSQTPEPKEKKPSRRAQKRIDELAVRNYINQLKSDTQPLTPKQREDALNYGEELDADPEVIQRLEADRDAERQNVFSQVSEQMKFNQFHTNLRIDAPQVENKYSFLNPKDKANFQEDIAAMLNQEYLTLVGYDDKNKTVQNPNLSYADFIEARVQVGNAIASRKTSQSAKNIAKQAANTGLRPDGSAAKGLDLSKHPKDMTKEELDQAAKLEAQALKK